MTCYYSPKIMIFIKNLSSRSPLSYRPKNQSFQGCHRRWIVVYMVSHCLICHQISLSYKSIVSVSHRSNSGSLSHMDSFRIVFSSLLVEKTTWFYHQASSYQSSPWPRRRTVHLSLYYPSSLFLASCYQTFLDSGPSIWMENCSS